MNTIKYLLSVAVAGVALSGCNDLSQEPLSSVVTADQKQQILEDNPEMMAASIAAIPQMTSSRFAIWGGDPRIDSDFGIPSIFMILDHRGQDMPSALNGYQWYTAAMEMSDFGGNYYDNYIIWNTNYNLIKSCNSVCQMIEPTIEDPRMQYFRAQALGYRAYAYLILGQAMQFTYAKNPQAPTVPLILDTNMDQAAAEGMGRASCEDLYAQIKADLNEAIALLDKAEESGYSRATQASGMTEKTYINQTVAYGLLARADLLTLAYGDAAIHAQKAIDYAKAENLEPYSMTEVSRPGIINITDHSWVWGFYVDPNTLLTGLIGWGGQMMPWHATACYPGAGVYRCINKKLFESISSADVRKGWWFDGTTAPRTLPSSYSEYLKNGSQYGLADYSPYMQVKFGAYNDEPGATTNAEDVPYMRVEELYLMLAEAQGMQSVATGAATLTNFVSTYRQPGYTCSATTTEQFRDEIWRQRRIELWGEGFSYFDMMRFQKGIDRRGAGYDPTLVYVVSPDDPVLIYEINTKEAQANPLIGSTSNGASVPQAVAE